MIPVEMARRWAPYALGLGLPLAVLSPLVSGAPDSFPLSTYPMFSQPRGQPTLYAVVAQMSDGREQRLSPELVGSKEVLQAKVLIQRSVDAGPESMAALCRETAARVAAAAAFGAARGVAIVRRQYDPIGYFTTGPAPIAEETLLECPVLRASSPAQAGG